MPEQHQHIWEVVYQRYNYEIHECYCGKKRTIYDE